MRHVSTIASVLVLIWAVSVLLRIPTRELSWTVMGYVMAQCLFALIAWWGLQRESLSSKGYAVFFALGFFAVLGMAMIATGRFLAVFPPTLAILVLVGTIGSALATSFVVVWRLTGSYPQGIPFSLLSIVFQAVVLSFCGSATLLTLFAEHKPAMRIAATSIGTFWFLLGGFFFAYSVGIVRVYGTWSKLNQYLPMMLAIATFAWMAFQLSGLQFEGSKQTVTQPFLTHEIGGQH